MRQYTRSEEYLARAERTIPCGSQTFGKSRRVYPFGVSPFFVTHGAGSRVWDVDENEYIDFNNGLGALTLGYNDADVTRAVAAQLEQGVIFSLSHPLEMVVAEMIVERVPCAEMVRFGKNGSDVTTAAIRLARAYTSRDRVAVCGYHGWPDWYMGTTTYTRGIPQATRDLTHPFAYNDLDSLRGLFALYPGEIAAVILEPMNRTYPLEGYLSGVAEIARDNGALLIFDEMITGFRLAVGGAQEYFSVTPDLATFGKGLANGYPLSALAGRADVMGLMEHIHFSLTSGGETLSLAAAAATLQKLTTHSVIEKLAQSGGRLKQGIEDRIHRHGVGHILGISGHPTGTWMLFTGAEGYEDWQIQSLYLQEILARGILSFGKHNISYAHTDGDIDRLLAVYDEVLPIIKEAVGRRDLEQRLRCEALRPFYRLR